MGVIIQNASPATAEGKAVDQKLTNRGSSSDGYHRVQITEDSVDEDGVITQKLGFVAVNTAEAAQKLMQDLASGKKIAVLGGRQNRNGNIYNVTVSLAVAE